MHYDYNPNSAYEHFGLQIYNLLAEQFEQTFFVGGMVRDLLLQKTITDIDIATAATPEQIILLLEQNNIVCDAGNKKFGVVIAQQGIMQIEITTLRTESYTGNRYPEVVYSTDPRTDSARRDFTINALYFSPKQGEIYDFYTGLEDLTAKLIRFIGDPDQRITEDPLRIVRAHRFQMTLQFNFEMKTAQALQKLHYLLKNISSARVETEINKISDNIVRQQLRKVIHNSA